MCACVHAYMRTCVHAYMRTCVHVYMYIYIPYCKLEVHITFCSSMCSTY